MSNTLRYTDFENVKHALCIKYPELLKADKLIIKDAKYWKVKKVVRVTYETTFSFNPRKRTIDLPLACYDFKNTSLVKLKLNYYK